MRCAVWRTRGASRRVFSPRRGEETAFPERFFPRPETLKPARRIAAWARSKNHRITPSHSRPIRFFASGDATKGRVSNREGGKKSCGLVSRDWTGEESYAFARYFFSGQWAGPLGLQTNNIVSDPIASSSWQIKKEKRDCARVRDDFVFGCCCFKPEMRHNFVTGSLFRIVPRSGHSRAPPAAAAS